MSFFHIVNMKFLLCNEFINKIKRILSHYKVLITNRYCIDISRYLIDFIFDADYSRVEETQPVMADDTHYLPQNLGYRFNHSIDGVVTLKHKTTNKKIQIISVANTDGMTTYEFGQFDFTFLKNF